jgi:YVTN family beta-propeller protein
MYVANGGSSTVSVISNRTVVATLPVGNYPDAIAYNPSNNNIYVAHDGSNNVTVISGTSIVGNVTITAGVLHQIAFNPSNNYIYVTTEPPTTVYGYNATTAFVCVAGCSRTISVISGTHVVATIQGGLGSGFQGEGGIVFDPSNDYMYVANRVSNSITVISNTTVVATIGPICCNTTAVTTNVTFGCDARSIRPCAFQGPRALAFNPSDNLIYMADNTGIVYMISGTSVVGIIPDVGGGGPKEFAFNPSNDLLYIVIANWGHDFDIGMYAILGATVVGVVMLGPPGSGTGSFALTYNPSNGEIYTANFFGNTASVVLTTILVANLPVGSLPDAIGFSPADKSVYVLNLGSSSASIISG